MMLPSTDYCFSTADGSAIYSFTLSNSKGTTVTITNYGAIIQSFKIKNLNEEVNDIVLGFDKVENYVADEYRDSYCYLGCAIGRYANRIKDATINIETKKHLLTANQGKDLLHGGANGFDKKVWNIISTGETPNPFIELQYISKDGEEGFPGTLTTTLKFELTEEDELAYSYTATTDKATAINLTHHSYFNLNNGKGTIKNHKVKIYSNSILEQDEGMVTNGNNIAIGNTPYDFLDFKMVAAGLNYVSEYDQSFVVNKEANDNKLQLVGEVKSDENKLLLQVYSTEPIVHFYSGKWIGELQGKNGTIYGSFSGLCLETHTHPNAINIPTFPDTVLREGEVYFTQTVYKVIALEK